MTAQAQARSVPYYVPLGDDFEIFQAAWHAGVPVMLKGPTGCGKTRLVEHAAAVLDVPLYTVSCHEDLTASDLLGRHLLVGGNTEWVDGPLTRAAREGGICYLDEIVEARQDATVAIHSLADHRRQLHLERHGGEMLTAADGFMLVVSYNPGYQSVLKDLKTSTRQRLVGITLHYPSPEIEREIVAHEAGVSDHEAGLLVGLGAAIRRVPDTSLREVASTRTLINAGALFRCGISLRAAAVSAIADPLTDDPQLHAGLVALIDTHLQFDR